MVKRIPIYTKGANVINSHVLYKIIHNDDGSLKLKALTASHGNEDDLKDQLYTDCTMCPPNGIRLLQSIASLFGWKIFDVDALTAVLQTGDAEQD